MCHGRSSRRTVAESLRNRDALDQYHSITITILDLTPFPSVPMQMRQALLVIAVLPLITVAATAQGPTVSSAQTTLRDCSYETCALRLSSRVFRGVAVSRGLNGPQEQFGFAGGSLRRAVSAVPAALAEAEIGHRRYVRGGIFTVVGTLASVGLALLATRDANSRDLNRNLWIGAGTMGLVTASGAIEIARGDEHYSRAIWLYNKEIPR